ncbi:PAQR family membrane homeostasis protein TrhA [Zavarzinella formosa]|uniref:PAQR family membrane homeostasis protein TrhA n=1 Tax=Zavarzinella formosa TaxID=360055 RepID=UPI0002D9B94F|nr:hemolysin III family protein [Zavarzinella formosa]
MDKILRDPFSAGTHLLMAGATLFVAVILLRLAWGNRLRRIDVGMFGFSMVFLYTCSGLFHAVHLPPEERDIFRNLDMTAIYFLIAGSFTPLIVTFVPGLIRAVYLVFMWSLVVAGVLVLWLVQSPPYPVVVAIYIGLGMVGLLGVRYYIRGAGRRAMPLLIFEPVIYIAGAVIDVLQWPVIWPGVIGPHEVFHLTDILGTLAHISIMMLYVIPVLRKNIRKHHRPVVVDEELAVETANKE